MSSVMPIILPMLFGGALSRLIGCWMALRLGRLTRGTIETPDEWFFLSNTGHARSTAWLKQVGESSHIDWSRKARLALRLQRVGMLLFFAGWVAVMTCIVLGI